MIIGSFANNPSSHWQKYIQSAAQESKLLDNTMTTDSAFIERDGVVTALRGSPTYDHNPIDLATIHDLLLSKSPREVFARLNQGFAIYHINTQNKKALIAIDKLGRERIVFRANPERIEFADNIDDLLSASEQPTSLRRQSIFTYLFFHMIPAPHTIYTDIHKLPLAHFGEWDNGKFRTERYWRPVFNEQANLSKAEYREALHSVLAEAVKNAAKPRSGTFLSGGLDSSTVSGKFGEHEHHGKAFSVGFGVPEYDERKYARIAAKKFNLDHHEIELVPNDVVESLPLIAANYDEPFGNSSVIPTFICARLAKENGVDHLLAGDGGDELFAGNERYQRQSIFELYFRLPRFVRDRVVQPIANQFDSEKGFVAFRKLRSYVDQATTPLPERLESWNFAYREGVARMLSPELAAEIDIDEPTRVMRDAYQSTADDATTLNKLLTYDWRFTLADNDLRKVSHMCTLAGVEVSYPMLDDRLVDLSTQIPSSMKMDLRALRKFYKDAMTGYLPNEIINKEKHGFGLPFGVWLKTERTLANLVHDAIANLRLRNFFQTEFLDELLEQQRAGHASYYGYFIWDLVMLELWLTSKGFDATKA